VAAGSRFDLVGDRNGVRLVVTEPQACEEHDSSNSRAIRNVLRCSFVVLSGSRAKETALQFFEALFLLVLAVGIARLLGGPIHPRLTYSAIAAVGVGLIVIGIVSEGFRWQMVPAYVGFGMLTTASLKKSQARLVWRALGAFPLVILLSASALLSHALPILSLPEPSGPYGVGTFDYSITDDARAERYSPSRNRELYVEVWYPADKGRSSDFPVRTLFQELYEGDYTRQSLLFRYLEHIPTHSHVHAPVAEPVDGPFPVLLFNHALELGFTSQNLLLMEHLASHGYVVLSVAHPYQASKVNLVNAGTITRAREHPADLNLTRPELPQGLVGKIYEASNDLAEVSAAKEVLSPLAEAYFALDESDRRAFLTQAAALDELRAYRQFISEDSLEDYFIYDYAVQNSLVQYWVDDIRFVATELEHLQPPVAGFAESIDISGFGVFGMSFGGAAAGEFCKNDDRCKAGVNLDGTQFGRHWNQPVSAPFLMLYNEEHQGGNDFAYPPSAHDFWDYGIKGSTHFDFTDFSYLWPLLETLGYTGPIDAMRMVEIVNVVVLNFFDHTLRAKPIPGELFSDIPEITVGPRRTR
jgi:predicted dienelactone hydrolase